MKKTYLQLVNKHHPLKKTEQPRNLVKAPLASDNIYVAPEVAEQFLKLVKKIEVENEILILDGYRSESEQQALWNFSLESRGEEATEAFVAFPGCSEHQTGLAIDVGLKKAVHDKICPTFENDEIVDKFTSEMMNFGFILRYPKNKTETTGIAYEPWHFRYVGLPHSQIITQQNWTLEEYFEYLDSLKEFFHDDE